MKRAFLENFGLKAIALLLALLAWFYVNLVVNPQVTRTLVLPLRVLNAPASTYLKPLPATCEFVVTAGRRDFIAAQAQDLSAYLDLAAVVHDRRNRVPVTDNLPPSLRIRSRKPEFEYVEPILLASREIPVRVTPRGQVKPRYYCKELSAIPPVVHVTGPRHYLELLGPLTLEVNLTDRIDDVDEERAIFRDVDRVPGLTCNVPSVRVRATVAPLPTKDVPVECDIVGEPAEGFEILSKAADPEKVTVQGAPEVIKAVRRVRTAPIDVSGLANGMSMRARLRLERTEGVFLDREDVQVIIGVSERTTRKTLKGVAIRLDAPDAYEVRLERHTVDLELTGPLNALKRLSPKSVEVSLLVKSVGRGVDLPLVVLSPERVEWSPRTLRADVWARAGTEEDELPGSDEYGPPAPSRKK